MSVDVEEVKKDLQLKLLEDESKDNREHWDPLIDSVKWIERYAESLEKLFNKLPDFVGTIIATFAVFTFGYTLRGEWVVILVSALNQINGKPNSDKNVTTEDIYKLITLENLKMQHFGIIFVGAYIGSYGLYFTIGGSLHWYFYIKRRHLAHDWKIQKDKWITPELERHEIMLGCFSLFFTSSVSAFLACYIYNENPSTVYYQFDEYGWIWFFLQFPDYTTYMLHRLYHTPWLYKRFHKLHHKYLQPTVFSVTAIHPVEIIHFQLTNNCPISALLYTITSMVSSTILVDDFKAQWWQPWQPDADFHDLHHQLYSCNYGFNMTLWDKLYGTTRKHNRIYTEEGNYPLQDSKQAASAENNDCKQNGDNKKDY